MFGGAKRNLPDDEDDEDLAELIGFSSTDEIFKINLDEENFELLPTTLLEKRSNHAVIELDGMIFRDINVILLFLKTLIGLLLHVS